MITLDGEAYKYSARSDALGHSRNLASLVQQNEFVGTFGQRVRVVGTFGPAGGEHDHETLERGEVGRLSITTLDNGGEGPFTPLLEIHFLVRDEREEAIIQEAWHTAFASNGAHLNAMLDTVDDVDGWIGEFAEGLQPKFDDQAYLHRSRVRNRPVCLIGPNDHFQPRPCPERSDETLCEDGAGCGMAACGAM